VIWRTGSGRLTRRAAKASSDTGKAGDADEAAGKASKRRGALILSYECCDCGLRHIGHADRSQIAARRRPERPKAVETPCGECVDIPCVECGKVLTPHRLRDFRQCGSTTMTCSKDCTNARNRRARERKQSEKRPERWLLGPA